MASKVHHHAHGHHPHLRGNRFGQRLHTQESDTSRPLTLAQASADQRVKIVAIEGGRCMRVRLAELGIAAGDIVRVIQNYGGPIILAVKQDTRMAIGHHMASHITIELAD